jgi:hypothetical protein
MTTQQNVELFTSLGSKLIIAIWSSEPTEMEVSKELLSSCKIAVNDLCRVGPIVITEIGQGNIYFTSVWFNSQHYCKVNH